MPNKEDPFENTDDSGELIYFGKPSFSIVLPPKPTIFLFTSKMGITILPLNISYISPSFVLTIPVFIKTSV